MKKIRILSEKEIKSIAAGEVIENAASIIKELVENAIDAKASSITISFINGGLDEISIQDDGIGISKDDLPLIFIPHATSKFLELESLYLQNNIFFGFRGEALSSIGAVSQTVVTSKEADSENGYQISSFHGQISEVSLAPANKGTKIVVTNLFDNIAVRKKYLKSTKSQEKNILHTITGLALSHPIISFIIHKNKSLYKVYNRAEDFQKRAFSLIENEKEKYLPIFYQDEYIKLEGVISKSEYGYYDRSKIYILANNRLIKQNNISQPCIKPYYAENFVKRYPELYLSIHVEPDQIDVNIHPRKEEVAFLYQKKIENILYSVIEKTITAETKSKIQIPKTLQTNHAQPYQKNDEAIASQKFNEKITKPIQKPITEIAKISKTEKSQSFPPNNTVDQSQLPPETTYKKKVTDNISNDIQSNPIKNENNIKEEINQKIEIKKDETPQQISIPKEKEASLNYLGILNKTYIIVLKEKSILCIDQHALHEKILYEKYLEEYNKNSLVRQKLLFPEKINIEQEDISFFYQESPLFSSLGIEYEIDKKTIYITECFKTFLKLGIEKTLLSSYQALYQKSELSFKDKKSLILHEIAAMYACKNAIKAGDKLHESEIKTLLSQGQSINNASFCPHGRPTHYQIYETDLEKFFKRK